MGDRARVWREAAESIVRERRADGLPGNPVALFAALWRGSPVSHETLWCLALLWASPGRWRWRGSALPRRLGLSDRDWRRVRSDLERIAGRGYGPVRFAHDPRGAAAEVAEWAVHADLVRRGWPPRAARLLRLEHASARHAARRRLLGVSARIRRARRLAGVYGASGAASGLVSGPVVA